MNTMTRVWGYSPRPNVNGRMLDRATETAKAVRVTVQELDGEPAHADTTWLPKSIATDLQIRRVVEGGVSCFEVSALVPKWWAAKLDTRPGWAKRGERCPEGHRPW